MGAIYFGCIIASVLGTEWQPPAAIGAPPLLPSGITLRDQKFSLFCGIGIESCGYCMTIAKKFNMQPILNINYSPCAQSVTVFQNTNRNALGAGTVIDRGSSILTNRIHIKK